MGRGGEGDSEALVVSLSKTAPGADLGGGIKYSNESEVEKGFM